MKSISILVTVSVIIATIFLPACNVKEQTIQMEYPNVFVHGLAGWGSEEGLNEYVPYWGATACQLITELEAKGYDCFEASVGPFSSSWDRACELYAQLTGSIVDYGEAHAKEHNHERYGRIYDNERVRDWGLEDADGNLKKINLIGHSFGGNTITLLAYLLEHGDETERNATTDGTICELFEGGKGNWVNSVTTLCTPHNGSTLFYMLEGTSTTALVESLILVYAGLLGRSSINGFVDFHLEQFGVTTIPGEGVKPKDYLRDCIKLMLEQVGDNVATDLSPDGTQKYNDILTLYDKTYYFSYAYQTTHESPSNGNQVADSNTLTVLKPIANWMGKYSQNKVTDYPIDETWLPNDGLVSVVSAKRPNNNNTWVDFNEEKIDKGIWNVMPTLRGDHGTVIGLGSDKETTISFYTQLIDMINSLPATKD